MNLLPRAPQEAKTRHAPDDAPGTGTGQVANGNLGLGDGDVVADREGTGKLGTKVTPGITAQNNSSVSKRIATNGQAASCCMIGGRSALLHFESASRCGDAWMWFLDCTRPHATKGATSFMASAAPRGATNKLCRRAPDVLQF